MVWLWFLNLSSVPGAEENFAAEAAAARGAGIPVALIDHDALAEPGGAQRGGLTRLDDDRRPVRRAGGRPGRDSGLLTLRRITWARLISASPCAIGKSKSSGRRHRHNRRRRLHP